MIDNDDTLFSTFEFAGRTIIVRYDLIDWMTAIAATGILIVMLVQAWRRWLSKPD